MKKILVLGAGMVAGPLVSYLLERKFQLTVTSLVLEDAVQLIGGDRNGTPLSLDLADEAALSKLVADHDLTISLVPYSFHPVVAGYCLEHEKHLITASYVAPAMQELDEQAQAKGLVFLNEIGLDPGIDHMSAMRIIDDVHERGGRIVHFRSYCGGLPAPDANDNPYGYKFSWAPRGVLLASRNGAAYQTDGHVVETPAEELFRDMRLVKVPDAGFFEAYPNRNSLMYREIYGLDEGIQSIFRATLRNIGWCDTLYHLGRIGYLSDEVRPAAATRAAFTRELLGLSPEEDAAHGVAHSMGLATGSLPAANLIWLGLLDETPMVSEPVAPMDLLCDVMLEKLVYADGERDAVVLFHEFKARFDADDRNELLTSTLVDYGVPHGDTSMSRTVSLPAAIAARLILEDKIPQRGVLRPVFPEIYNAVLDELAELNIECKEVKSVY